MRESKGSEEWQYYIKAYSCGSPCEGYDTHSAGGRKSGEEAEDGQTHSVSLLERWSARLTAGNCTQIVTN